MSTTKKTTADPKRQSAKAKPLTKPARRETKQDKLLKMLSTKTGATVPAMAKAAGWQEHSIRGFMSAVVRQKLGHELASEGEGSVRRYRIVDAPAKSGAKR